MLETIIAQFMTILMPAILAAVGILVPWLLNELRRWAKTKSDNETIDIAFNQLAMITKSAVTAAEQSIKEAGADGKITLAEAKKVKTFVMASIKNQMPKSTEKALSKIANSVDTLIDDKIEETVFNLKKEK